MRIGIDLRMIGGGSGIDRYLTELTHEVLKLDKTNQFVLFFRDANKSAPFQAYGHKIVVADIAHYSLAEQLRLPRILNKENLDLVHFPHFNVPIFYRKPFVLTIHDLTHTLFPGKKMSRIFHRLAYHLVFNSAILHARKIIAVSESTKKQILERFGIDSDKITVIYEGFSQVYKMMDKQEAFAAVSQKFGITKPYLLYVGVWRRYKNLPMLAQAFDKLIAKGLDLQFVIAGQPDDFYPEIKDQIFAIKNSSKIKAVGKVTDEDLKLLYNGANLFVLPSLMEGFGLTALEAAGCGVPVACSDIATLREIMGQGAEYFDPESLGNMVDVLYNLLTDPKQLEELANLGLSRSKHFSWSDAAEKTLNLYQAL
ncbi:MAG: hypothetical protein A2660_00675 [Candidatus Doudnabacteria bacterium RIFCSPHIGHO2_01_FULL_45_18]|uniref:Glycosyl transferase family 1 domain-containing protein n=1 Tax=Candidatus Doudnabacteria bacterium RIFCSPHIGHO2_01_FULL_45_18 TaxID=1817823 RepID=A0A1F5NQ09_9BACT|nr:MAG: hypothetical protein A2660_00675 [Candidatus Doudnabacteria bacterium RIFCSPHIGHO2_01_FULL_45_18]